MIFIRILHRHLLQGKPAPFEIVALNDFCLPRGCSWGHTYIDPSHEKLFYPWKVNGEVNLDRMVNNFSS